MSGSEEQTKNSAELLRAALATADLSQPVRFFNGETGGFVLQTAKGENTPARISEQSLDEMTAYFEEILSVLDKEVALADDEDGTAVDLLTAPAWFGPYKYMDAFYVMVVVSARSESKQNLDRAHLQHTHSTADRLCYRLSEHFRSESRLRWRMFARPFLRLQDVIPRGQTSRPGSTEPVCDCSIDSRDTRDCSCQSIGSSGNIIGGYKRSGAGK